MCAKNLKERVHNTHFSVISNNCWGAEIYRELDLPYATPFVGLFLFSPCYIRMLKNLKGYLSQSLSFVETSLYEEANRERETMTYPIGLLGGDVEVHFQHYKNTQEAEEKWSRRTSRILWDRLFVEFCDRDRFTMPLLEEFEKMEFVHKVFFSSKNYRGFRLLVWIKECKKEPCVMEGVKLYAACKKYFDIADWLNGGSGRLKFTQKVIHRFSHAR